MTAHPLLPHLLAAARGSFPPVDGVVEVLPACGRNDVVVAFTGHSFVCTDAPDADGRVGDGFGGSLAPDVLRWLAGPTGWIDSIDALLVADGLGGGTLAPTTAFDDHHRVAFARRVRDDVDVYGDERGLFTIATALAGHRECSVEVDPANRSRGNGRSLLLDARRQTPEGELLFAAVAPGNAASLRAFLAAGFRPIGSQVLIQPVR